MQASRPAVNDTPPIVAQLSTAPVLSVDESIIISEAEPRRLTLSSVGFAPLPVARQCATVGVTGECGRGTGAAADSVGCGYPSVPITPCGPIVTDTLTWFEGLGGLAPRLPIPDLPVPASFRVCGWGYARSSEP